MLNVAVIKPILKRATIVVLVRQRTAAGMAENVRSARIYRLAVHA